MTTQPDTFEAWLADLKAYAIPRCFEGDADAWPYDDEDWRESYDEELSPQDAWSEEEACWND